MRRMQEKEKKGSKRRRTRKSGKEEEKKPSAQVPLLLKTMFGLRPISVARGVRLCTVPVQAVRGVSTCCEDVGWMGAGLCAAQSLLETVAVDGGLGWTAGIVATTVGLRSLVTLPIMVSQLKTAARIELEAKPQIDAWRERIKGEIFRKMQAQGIRSFKGHTAPANNEKNEQQQPGMEPDIDVEMFQQEFERQLKAKVLEIYREHRYHPLQSLLLPLAQIPLWVTLSLALRRITAGPLLFFPSLPAPLPGLKDGGILWFHDLTLPDPTWTFPLIIGNSYLLNVEVEACMLPFVLFSVILTAFLQLGLLSRKTELTRFQTVFTNAIRVASIFMIFIAKQVPMVSVWRL